MQFKGVYHVLGGVISPMDGVKPDDIKIKDIIDYINMWEDEIYDKTLWLYDDADSELFSDELIEKVKGIDKEELVAEIKDKIEEIKEELADLDKETVLEIAKEKAEGIKEKAEEIYEIAKEKATPVIETAADEVRKKALAVVKDIEKKLSK